MLRPLDGVKVIDCSVYQNWPQSTVMLADMGAEVIKVDHLSYGEVRIVGCPLNLSETPPDAKGWSPELGQQPNSCSSPTATPGTRSPSSRTRRSSDLATIRQRRAVDSSRGSA